MTTLGILQYVSPSILFLLSVLVFNESLQLPRLIDFALIWGRWWSIAWRVCSTAGGHGWCRQMARPD